VTRDATRVLGEGARAAEPERRPRVYERWWFWTIVGVAVAGGVTAGVLLANQPAATPALGQDVTVEAITFQ
jgi:hypothetical protein